MLEPNLGPISLRDWFAGQALEKLIATDHEWFYPPHELAKRAYILADAMIAEREKSNEAPT